MWIPRIVGTLFDRVVACNEDHDAHSDFNIMNTTVELAKENGVKVGAHPSLPDLQGFGRREMAIEPVSSTQDGLVVESNNDVEQGELMNCFMYQVGALSGFLKLHGLPMNHVSPPVLLMSIKQGKLTHYRSNHTARSTDKRLAPFHYLAKW